MVERELSNLEKESGLIFIRNIGIKNISKSEKPNYRTVWEVQCKVCSKIIEIRANTLHKYKSCGCNKGNKETKDSLINKINNTFPEHSLDFTKLIFKEGQHSKQQFYCKLHGTFESTANRLLNSTKDPCIYCNSIKTNKSLVGDISNFIQKAYTKYGDIFSYDKVSFKALKDNIEVYCKEHQEYFTINANNFLYSAKIGCPLCIKGVRDLEKSKLQTIFLNLCSKVHGDIYDLTNVEYKGWNEPIEVICKIHGAWHPTAGNFKRGSGCPYCGNISKEERYSDQPTLFYIFKIKDIFKIGITTKSIEARYLGKDLSKNDFNNIEIIFQYEFNTGRLAFLLEQKIRSLYKEYAYKGISPFKHTRTTEILTVCPDLKFIEEEILNLSRV